MLAVAPAYAATSAQLSNLTSLNISLNYTKAVIPLSSSNIDNITSYTALTHLQRTTGGRFGIAAPVINFTYTNSTSVYGQLINASSGKFFAASQNFAYAIFNNNTDNVTIINNTVTPAYWRSLYLR